MLCFDRYLRSRSRTLDLSTGNIVQFHRVDAGPQDAATLFASRDGCTVIDLAPVATGRVEVWEPWVPRRRPRKLEDTLLSFREVLESAREGAPRAFDLNVQRRADQEYLRRAIAREARLLGWVPIDVELLAAFMQRGRRPWPAWIADRTLVVFAETPGLPTDAMLAMLRLARRDTRPHVVVRSLVHKPWRVRWMTTVEPAVHEALASFGERGAKTTPPTLRSESGSRWALMLDEMAGGPPAVQRRALELAEVLAAREQPFEAHGLLARIESDDADGEVAARKAAIEKQLASRVASRRGGWEMVDDFVGVLRICQDVEDEHAALSRVGAYVRERLQASTVAFVAREATGPRVLTRVGSEAARIDLAVRSIETGLAIPAARDDGPVESACPVRHASEVIGAVWCRWGAGMPVASDKAAALLGVAAAAAAPSLRLAIARREISTASPTPIPELVGQSAAMTAVREAILRAAASPFPVLIEGESGSGKELAARAIHARSPRRDKRFSAINCAALVDELVEAELFGHTRGAFTGAQADRAGLFEEADNATLFLDEVAELGPRVQAKLLRVLQEGEVRRLGETIVRKVDVRIVAATNRPLAGEVSAGRFRKDLWYRLDVIRVTLPPLAGHLWRSLSARTGSKAVLSPAAIAALSLYDWPGNVRELQNVLASLMAASPASGLIGPSALPAHLARAAAIERATTLNEARRQFEERFVRAALARAGGRVVPAARELGLTRQGLLKLMARLGIDKGTASKG
jgi:DNA-binding NtrC family response regulator